MVKQNSLKLSQFARTFTIEDSHLSSHLRNFHKLKFPMNSLTFSCLMCALNLHFAKKNCSRLLEQQRIAPNTKRCLKVAEHNRDRPNDTCVLMINTIVYDLSLSKSPFNKDVAGGGGV